MRSHSKERAILATGTRPDPHVPRGAKNTHRGHCHIHRENGTLPRTPPDSPEQHQAAPRTAAATRHQALCALHKPRKYRLTWGRVTASIPFQQPPSLKTKTKSQIQSQDQNQATVQRCENCGLKPATVQEQPRGRLNRRR